MTTYLDITSSFDSWEEKVRFSTTGFLLLVRKDSFADDPGNGPLVHLRTSFGLLAPFRRSIADGSLPYA